MRYDTTDSADEFFAKYYDVGTELDNDDDDDYLDAVDYVLVRRTDLKQLAAALNDYRAGATHDRFLELKFLAAAAQLVDNYRHDDHAAGDL